MKLLRSPQLLSVTLGLVFLAACATTGLKVSQPTDFIEPMRKLTSAVKAELDNPYSTNRPSGNELLVAAMNEKPELQRAFKNIPVLITNQSGKAVLLLPSRTDRKIAWLEFATWSRGLEKFHYLSNPPSPAEFTITLPRIAAQTQR